MRSVCSNTPKHQSTLAQPFWALQSPLLLLFADGGLRYQAFHRLKQLKLALGAPSECVASQVNMLNCTGHCHYSLSTAENAFGSQQAFAAFNKRAAAVKVLHCVRFTMLCTHVC